MRVNWGTKRRTWADAVYSKPAEDGKSEEAFSFRVFVEALTDGEIAQLLMGERHEAEDLVVSHVLDWSGPKDENGDPVPFDPDELRDGINQDPDVREAVLRALMWASREGVRKNSRTSPG